jgi:hypothetical protein
MFCARNFWGAHKKIEKYEGNHKYLTDFIERGAV